jgi:DNA-binding response OmpR family regulator
MRFFGRRDDVESEALALTSSDASTQEAERPRFSPRDVLIAEDDDAQAAFLRTILEHASFNVTRTENGREAWDYLQELRSRGAAMPALVLSDIVMPETTGFELCAWIKNDPVLKHVPVVLITLLTDPNEVVQGLYAGADSLIAKPYEPKYLLARIEHVRNSALNQGDEEHQLQIRVGGKKHTVTAERLQAVELLLSSYEIAVQKNEELAQLRRQLEDKDSELRAAKKELEQLRGRMEKNLPKPLV